MKQHEGEYSDLKKHKQASQNKSLWMSEGRLQNTWVCFQWRLRPLEGHESTHPDMSTRLPAVSPSGFLCQTSLASISHFHPNGGTLCSWQGYGSPRKSTGNHLPLMVRFRTTQTCSLQSSPTRAAPTGLRSDRGGSPPELRSRQGDRWKTHELNCHKHEGTQNKHGLGVRKWHNH